ncbi:Histone deacetylase complex subunit CTI6 [Fusarium oxysporum f. sp. albedinis]|nr:Histone deacetylase complex subunit CTI6 [Fusarium oxysporum f. sp. albedinis]
MMFSVAVGKKAGQADDLQLWADLDQRIQLGRKGCVQLVLALKEFTRTAGHGMAEDPLPPRIQSISIWLDRALHYVFRCLTIQELQDSWHNEPRAFKRILHKCLGTLAPDFKKPPSAAARQGHSQQRRGFARYGQLGERCR